MDDMFVILSSWENLDEKTHKEKSISERIGLTLKEAVSCVVQCDVVIGCSVSVSVCGRL